MSQVCIVIPFFNEAKRINRKAFHDFLIQESSYHMLLVDDGSSDDTINVLQEIHISFPKQVKVLKLKFNSGKAQAVRLGVLKALHWNNFEYLGYMDADLATPFEEAPYLISYFKESSYQFIIGSRVKLFGWNIHRSLKRHYFGRIFATYVSSLFKLNIYDTQCGAKFFRSDIAADLFEKEFISKWFFDIELFLRLRKELGNNLFKKSVKEVPLQNWLEKGESKLKFSDFLKTPLELHKIQRKYR